MTERPLTDTKLVRVIRDDANFDRACDAARSLALGYWDIPNWQRSTDSIRILFLHYNLHCGMGGDTHEYAFNTWAVRNEEGS